MATDFAISAGDDKTLTITVLDENESAVAITGATIAWRASRSHNKTADITKTTSSGITITDGPNGVFEVDLDADDTEDLKGIFYHEAQVTFVDGSISTVLKGRMKINPVLIRAT